MSGIFGIYLRHNCPLETEILAGMGQSMRHRGPDGIATYHNGLVGIGHCMMQTTPESCFEALPYHDKESGLVITADARIDNQEFLLSKLNLNNKVEENLPDSKIILEAYKKWGDDCVNFLVGDFSFVIWDAKKKQLFCARDHLGIKPFYYYLSENFFVFASEVRAILKVPQVPRCINEGRIADFLVVQLEGIDKSTTFYESIYRLLPAHSMLISRERVSVVNYWDLDPEIETRFKSDNDYIEAFQEIFNEAVRARLRCNSQPASMLSGGIDSSTIVAVANNITMKSGRGPLRVYSGVSGNEVECRETHFIKSVIRHCSLESFTVCHAELPAYKEKLQSVFDMLEEPFDAHMMLLMLVYLLAQKQENKVLLDGIDGDIVHSLSSSYPAYLLRKGDLFKAISEIKGLWQNVYYGKSGLSHVIRGAIYPALATQFMRRWRQRLFSRLIMRKIVNRTIINKEFADRVNLQERLRQLNALSGMDFHSTMRSQHIRNIKHPYLTVGLERYDRVAAVCSVEPRHPLLDKRLVEFSVSLPWEQKIRGGWSKFLIRGMAKSLLPDEVVWRKGREHLGGSFTQTWMQNNRNSIKKEIIIRRSLLSHYVDNQFLDRIVAYGYTMEPTDNVSGLWDVFQLANWLHRQSLNA